MGKIAKAIGIARGCESREMTTEESTELLRDRSRGRMGTLVDCMTVGSPQNVEGHCMTSLEMEPICPADESGVASGPGEECLMESDGGGELKSRTEV